MQVQFKNALFDSALFAFAVVNGSTLTIVLENAEIDLDFDSEAEALEAQAELGEVLDSVGSVSNVITDAANAVSGLISGLFGTAKAKVTKASTAKSAEDVATTLTDILEQALAGRPAATRPASRSTASEANDVFGTNRTSRADAADTVVSELTDAALRTAIEDKAASLLASDARVQAMVAQLRRFYSDAQVDEVIEVRKSQVFDFARANGNLTLNQIVAQILR
ncbi:hypothetical protein XbC2_520 [Xanthomonas phage XbC2]|nr:hypothetical protein XbC2_520 [Xanthomonas phage XbC2]